jgi:hypothetical protein
MNKAKKPPPNVGKEKSPGKPGLFYFEKPFSTFPSGWWKMSPNTSLPILPGSF